MPGEPEQSPRRNDEKVKPKKRLVAPSEPKRGATEIKYKQPRHAVVTCYKRVAKDTTLNLDTAVKLNIVNIQFVKRIQLKKTRHPNPVTQTTNETKIRTFNV